MGLLVEDYHFSTTFVARHTLDQGFQRAFKAKQPSAGRGSEASEGEEPLVTLDHNLVLEPVRLHVKLLCQDKRGAPI